MTDETIIPDTTWATALTSIKSWKAVVAIAIAALTLLYWHGRVPSFSATYADKAEVQASLEDLHATLDNLAVRVKALEPVGSVDPMAEITARVKALESKSSKPSKR